MPSRARLCCIRNFCRCLDDNNRDARRRLAIIASDDSPWLIFATFVNFCRLRDDGRRDARRLFAGILYVISRLIFVACGILYQLPDNRRRGARRRNLRRRFACILFFVVNRFIFALRRIMWGRRDDMRHDARRRFSRDVSYGISRFVFLLSESFVDFGSIVVGTARVETPVVDLPSCCM